MLQPTNLHKLLWEGGWNGEERETILTSVCGYEADFELDWWQSWYIRNAPGKIFLAANKSRRVGWSFITAADGLLKAIDRKKKRYVKQFVSYSMEDAKEKIKTAREFYESMPAILQPKKMIRASQTSLEFLDADGQSVSRLLSWPCKGPRGKGGDISLDEMAFYGIKAEEVYTAALGVIARGGSLEVGSTPFGQSGRFYEILSDRQQYSGYKTMEIPWYYSSALCTDWRAAIKAAKSLGEAAMVERFATSIMKDIFKNMPLPDFMQEYCLDFRDEKASFFTLKMIQANTPTGEDEIPHYTTLDDLIMNYDPAVHGTLYGGYDVGRTDNASELVVIGRHPDQPIKTMVGRMSWRNMRFDDQKANLNRFMSELPVHRLAMDKTGLGWNLAEDMEKSKGSRVEGVMFNAEIKETMAQAVYLGLERQEFLLPPDRDFQKQVHSIKKMVTAAGNVRYDTARNEGHHADAFWAFALADHAVSGGEIAKSGFYEQWKARKAAGGNMTSFSQAQILNRLRRRTGG